jgi:hypothetical protein
MLIKIYIFKSIEGILVQGYPELSQPYILRSFCPLRISFTMWGMLKKLHRLYLESIMEKPNTPVHDK